MPDPAYPSRCSFHAFIHFGGDDVAGIVVKNGRQIKPAPADDFQIGEIGLPHLVRARGLVPELVICQSERNIRSDAFLMTISFHIAPINRA